MSYRAVMKMIPSSESSPSKPASTTSRSVVMLLIQPDRLFSHSVRPVRQTEVYVLVDKSYTSCNCVP